MKKYSLNSHLITVVDFSLFRTGLRILWVGFPLIDVQCIGKIPKEVILNILEREKVTKITML